jgi:hypothetical protein
MRVNAVALLATRPETGDWFRVTGPAYIPSAIKTTHTSLVPSRFYNPDSANPKFGTLYLSEDALVAQFEAQVLFNCGDGLIAAPAQSWVIAKVRVILSEIVDLSEPTAQAHLDVSAQELTGDWVGYNTRKKGKWLKWPTGTAPTQALGEALHADARQLEGFVAVSARAPERRNLVIFPDHLRRGSSVDYEWNDGTRNVRYRVDRGNPDGREVV